VTLSILYADDEPDIREVVTLALELDPELRVVAVDCGAAALAALDAGLVPDIILLDVMMPGMDGPATLTLIRERPALARTPVVFITARAQSHEQDRLRSLGAVGVITKPFDPMKLADELRELVEA
jgi:CheY-like chemotaxis protein